MFRLFLAFILLIVFSLEVSAQKGERRSRSGQSAPQSATGSSATVPQLATPADQVVPLTVVDPRQIGSITPSHVGIPYKVVQYASRILEKYDINGNGFLEREEWSKMPGAPQSIDTDGDFIISLDEMIRFIVLYGSIRTIHRPNPPLPFVSSNWDPATMSPFKPFSAPPKPKQEPNEPKTEPTAEIDENQIVGAVDSEPAEESGNEKEQEKLEELFYETVFAGQFNPAQRKYHVPLSELRGVPNWFVLRDKNGDGQLSMLEFDPTLSPKGLAEFARLDKNGDGFLTPDEVRVEQK